MNKTILIVLCCVFICLTGVTYAHTTHNTKTNNCTITSLKTSVQNHTPENKKTNIIKTNKNVNVVVTLKSPDKPQKRGKVVCIPYSVTNNMKDKVYNVYVGNVDFNRYIGVLKPGQTKRGVYKLYIPTDEDEFGEVNPDNPWDVGGIHVTFNDKRGIAHKVTSNPIKIKWYN